MDSKKFIIGSKVKINNKEAIGITIDSLEESLKELKELFSEKRVILKNDKEKEEGTIKIIDGYISYSNIHKINLFLETDIIDLTKFNVGDSVEILL